MFYFVIRASENIGGNSAVWNETVTGCTRIKTKRNAENRWPPRCVGALCTTDLKDKIKLDTTLSTFRLVANTCRRVIVNNRPCVELWIYVYVNVTRSLHKFRQQKSDTLLNNEFILLNNEVTGRK